MANDYPSHQPEYRRAYRNKRKEHLKVLKAKFYLRHREKLRAKARAYYLANRDKIIAKSEAWRKANPQRKNANKRRRYREAHEHFIAKSRLYCSKRKATGKAAAYREKTRLRQREWSRMRSAAITDDYAREQLSKYSTISARDWPQELVDAKKLEIQLKRLVRKSA